MTTAVMALLLVATAATVVWFTIGRTMLAVAAVASEIPVGPALGLFADPLCALRGVRLVEIVVWRDDVLVGFTGGRGSWLRRGEAGGERVVVVDDDVDPAGELCLRHAARDARSRRLLELWRTERRALTAVMNEGLGLAALVDEVSREALTVDLAYPVR